MWKTVVHRLCSGVTGASANLAEACKKDRHGALDLCSWPKFCPCPHSSVTNAIVAARRCGLPTVEVATANSPGCERAALEAGLGTHYEGVPLRESLRFADLVKHGFVPDQEALNELSTWYEPPELLVIDVAKSIRDGRIVAVPGP